ncbi:MAG: ribonuclease H-like domain-containing protein [Candidatus Acidiferrales bacterium]
MVVNAACHDDFGAIGRFAVVDVEPSGETVAKWREIRELSCVLGVGPSTVERLHQIGIRTLEKFAASSPEILCGAVRSGRRRELLLARARAIIENRPILLRSPELAGEREIFLDIETDLCQSYIWMIGVCVGRDGKYHNFFAQSPKEEKTILLNFLKFMEGFSDAKLLTCSGSRFEERVIRNRLTSHGLPTAVCDRMIDLYQTISRNVALPIRSSRVKEIGGFFGYRYKHPNLMGIPGDGDRRFRTIVIAIPG